MIAGPYAAVSGPDDKPFHGFMDRPGLNLGQPLIRRKGVFGRRRCDAGKPHRIGQPAAVYCRLQTPMSPTDRNPLSPGESAPGSAHLPANSLVSSIVDIYVAIMNSAGITVMPDENTARQTVLMPSEKIDAVAEALRLLSARGAFGLFCRSLRALVGGTRALARTQEDDFSHVCI